MSQNKSNKTHKKKKKSILLNKGRMILIITSRMIVLETFLDIQLALLHMDVNRVNHPLYRTHTSMQ
jgi:hypothetical protein